MSYHPPSCQYSFCTTFLCIFFSLFTKGLNFAFYIFCCFFYFLFFIFYFFSLFLNVLIDCEGDDTSKYTRIFCCCCCCCKKKKEHTRIEEKQPIDIVYTIFFLIFSNIHQKHRTCLEVGNGEQQQTGEGRSASIKRP